MRHPFLIACLCITLMPTILVLNASLRAGSTLMSGSPMTLQNYHRLLTETQFTHWMGNTLIVSSIASVVALVVTSLSGYAFSRFRFFGRKNGLLLMILLQMFPAAMSM